MLSRTRVIEMDGYNVRTVEFPADSQRAPRECASVRMLGGRLILCACDARIELNSSCSAAGPGEQELRVSGIRIS